MLSLSLRKSSRALAPVPPTPDPTELRLAHLEEQFIELTRQFWELQASYRKPLTLPVPTRPALRKPALFAERRIDCVLIGEHSKQMVALDQAGLPWREYSGSMRQVGLKVWKLCQNWQTVDDAAIQRLNFSW